MRTLTFTRAIAATVIGLASASAFAVSLDDGLTYPNATNLQSNMTRAQVRQELMQAKAAGLVNDGGAYPPPMSQSSDRTFAQVRAQLDAYKARGLAFNDATYPVPSHNLPNKQAQRELASLGAAGQPTMVR